MNLKQTQTAPRQAAITLAKKHGGKLIRLSRDAWTTPNRNQHDREFTHATILNLVNLKMAKFTCYQKGKTGSEYPSEVTLIERIAA